MVVLSASVLFVACALISSRDVVAQNILSGTPESGVAAAVALDRDDWSYARLQERISERYPDIVPNRALMNRLRHNTTGRWREFLDLAALSPINLLRPPLKHLQLPRDGSKRDETAPPPVVRRNVYSAFRCVGLSDAKDAPMRRTCAFANVCLNRRTGDLEYYQREQSPRPVIHFHPKHGSMYTFPEPFLALRSRKTDGHMLTPKVLDRTAPASNPDVVGDQGRRASGTQNGASWTRSLNENEPNPAPRVRTGFLRSLESEGNPGKMLWQDVYSGLEGLVQTDSYDPKTLFILKDSCEEYLAGQSQEEVAQCRRLLGEFVGVISNRPVVAWKHLKMPSEGDNEAMELEKSASEAIWGDQRLVGSERICFDRLVAGSAPHATLTNGVALNSGKEPTFWAYRCGMLESHGIDCLRSTKTQRVVVVSTMTEGRGLCDAEKVANWVREEYPNMQVDVIDWSGVPEFHDQLLEWTATSLVITPGGSVSTRMAFLPPGAHGIVVGSVKADHVLWAHMSHIATHFYAMQDATTELRSAVAGKAAKCIQVEKDRIIPSVKAAVAEISRGGMNINAAQPWRR